MASMLWVELRDGKRQAFDRVERALQQSKTIDEAAAKLGVKKTTLYKWSLRLPELHALLESHRNQSFSRRLRNGDKKAFREVERALLKYGSIAEASRQVCGYEQGLTVYSRSNAKLRGLLDRFASKSLRCIDTFGS